MKKSWLWMLVVCFSRQPDLKFAVVSKLISNVILDIDLFFFFGGGGITSYISNQSYDRNQLTLLGFPSGPVSLDITI